MLAGLPSEELIAGDGLTTQIRRVRVGDGHVLVTRLTTGEVVAFAPVCPHQFTELDEAAIRDGQLRCPRHGYQYDARTGENLHPRRDAPLENLWKLRPGYLPCYQVVEKDGWVSVSDEPLPPPASYDWALEQRPAREGDDIGDPVAQEAAPVAAPASPEQSMKFLTMVSGSSMEIRLPIVPRPGFAWQYDVVGQLLQVSDEQFESGYSPCQVIKLAADGVGAATLTCTYATEQGERAAVRTFIVRVQAG
jgi:nitrite reductase/ring-hydroxylating ferredoxin subunit